MGRRGDPSEGELAQDPRIDGPLKHRSCTDILCLILFLVFIAVWIGIGLYAIRHGDPSNLLVPKDSQGRRCGKDSDVKDRPYLFFQDLLKCLEPTVPFSGCKTPQVCVQKCPDNYYVEGGKFGPLDLQYCTDQQKKVCPSWYSPSESIQKRCVPLLGKLNETFLKQISDQWNMNKIKSAIKNIKLFSEAEEVGEKIIEDLINSWWKILIGLFFALVVCLIYVLMLRWVAAPIIWFSIIGILVALVAALYFTIMEFRNVNKDYSDAMHRPDLDESEINSYKTKKNLWLTALIVLSIFTLIIVLVLIVLRKRIKLAIALVKEGSKAVSSVTASLFFPIIPWVLQVGVILYAIAVALFLATTGSPQYLVKHIDINDYCNVPNLKQNNPCDPETFSETIKKFPECVNVTCKFVSIHNDAFYPYLQAINIFGFFWIAFFVSALGQMVLASVFAKWYWTFKKSKLPFFALTAALCRTLRYHIGTLAFGSLLIAICRIIRVILEYIDRKLKEYDNEITRAIMCCAKCIFWCLEKFIRFINTNAYIMCAIYGKNFCTSAKDAFSLLMRNILRVWVLDKVTDFLFFISSLLLTLGVGAVSYVLFATDLTTIVDNSNLNYGLVPVIIIMVCTYIISLLFFSVYSMAVDTLFLCFLEDCERNDGSAQKPYYMSRNLMKIFGKTNHRD